MVQSKKETSELLKTLCIDMDISISFATKRPLCTLFVAAVLLFDLCLQVKYPKDRWRRDLSPTAGGEASLVFVDDLVPLSPSALHAGSLLYGNFGQQKFIV